jgi:hypothetical protein
LEKSTDWKVLRLKKIWNWKVKPMATRHTEACTRRVCFDPGWARSPRGLFFRLIHLDPEKEGLSGVGGIFVIWHAGVRPQWVCVAAAEDLAAAIHRMADDADVMSYEVNGGLFVSWALVQPAYRSGAVAYLTGRLRPAIGPDVDPAAGITAIAVSPPGSAGGARRRDRVA